MIKAYVDQFHNDIERNRRDLGLSFYNEEVDLLKNIQDNDSHYNKLLNIDSVTVNRKPTLDNEVPHKKYIDDLIAEGTARRFSQTLQNYLKVSVGNNVYNLTKYDKIRIIVTTVNKSPNTGVYLLQN